MLTTPINQIVVQQIIHCKTTFNVSIEIRSTYCHFTFDTIQKVFRIILKAIDSFIERFDDFCSTVHRDVIKL